MISGSLRFAQTRDSLSLMKTDARILVTLHMRQPICSLGGLLLNTNRKVHRAAEACKQDDFPCQSRQHLLENRAPERFQLIIQVPSVGMHVEAQLDNNNLMILPLCFQNPC